MPASNESIRAIVLDALAASSGADRAAVCGSTRLLDLNVDSLALVSILSLAEAAGARALTAEDVAQVLRAPNVDALVAAIVGADSPSST